jgi:hypothetical protein
VTKQLVSLVRWRGWPSLRNPTTATRVFGTVYSMPAYVYKNLSRRLIDSPP